jgi:hypothetical protein
MTTRCHILTSALLATLLLTGCHQPSEIKLAPEEDAGNLEARAVIQPDSNVAVSSVDSSGILADEQLRFGAWLTVTHLCYDDGKNVKTASFSRVFIADSTLRSAAGLAGFRGMFIGPILLNGSLMTPVVHRVKGIGDSGVEYLANLNGAFESRYRWRAIPTQVGEIDQSIDTPDTIRLTSPAAGSVIPRSKDLTLRWRGGRGNLSVILSRYHEVRGVFIPLVEFRVRVNNGVAVVPASFLRQLPPSTLPNSYMLTFVLSTRREEIVVANYAGKLIMQAASIYNCFVSLK